ncbi:MAG: prepilin-type N-terminal cleavage/methylation domain-containing protein [Candidatus Binatia bacterium]|nr:prepilin-type N-terminal cleavage/methylation domain-containing protein [Candidatus Binatia bacterium]
MNRRTRRGERGFTLLEVMVALAILATAFTALLGLHAQNLKTIARERSYTESLFLARERLAQIELQGAPDVGETRGDFEGEYPGEFPGYLWELYVSTPGFFQNVREVTVRVIPPDGIGGAAELTLWVRTS